VTAAEPALQTRFRAATVASALGRHTLLWIWISVAVAVRIVFWAVTNRTWEDALITVAHARNAVEGLGLTHHPGEGLVHGFTSAVSVLIPLVGEALQEGLGLTAIRLASLVAAAATIAYAYAIARRLGLGAWPTSFVLGYLALNQNHIFYGMAGMETQVAVAVLLSGIFHVLSGHVARSGFAAGAAILARPDLILWGLPVLVWAALRGWRALLQAGLALGILVAPWLIFTTLYYGSPVPHTIPAKAAVWSPIAQAADAPDVSALVGDRVLSGVAGMVKSLRPFYEDGFVVGAPLPVGLLIAIGSTMLVLGVVGAWQTRARGSWLTVIGFATLFAVYRAAFLPVAYFDWYLPPWTAVSALLIGAGLQWVIGRTPGIGRGLVVALALAAAIHLPYTIPLEATIQREIEDGVRQPVGTYLGEVVEAGEAFVSESAGYFGYYSGATIWDHPGLTSPTAFAATRSLPHDERRVEALTSALRPEWAVLRPIEWERMGRDYPEAAACYSPVRSFGIPDRTDVAWDGLRKVSLDWRFTVYRRGSCP
jgi:hypothetical protein